ncbi:MAG: hypothetical protein PHC69_08270 [Ruminiclostridium sp.]|nr:hypothetical protein [Ruminiclostridium sp.]
MYGQPLYVKAPLIKVQWHIKPAKEIINNISDAVDIVDIVHTIKPLYNFKAN